MDTEQGPEQAPAPKARRFKAGTPTTFAKANARHSANLKKLKKMIDTGKSQKDSKWGKSWPNACQWLLAGKTSLHALTETHDSQARAIAQGKATMRAFFGINTAVPNASTYAQNNQNPEANVDLALPNWLGYRVPGAPSKVVIVDPVTKDTELVKETIVHEVQHDADHYGPTNFDGYHTEFDAYWIDKTYVRQSPRSGTANNSLTANDGTLLSGFDNARQQTIFAHLYNSKASYGYVSAGWAVAAFKAQVLALKRPRGMNLINSVRIDDLYLELTKAPPNVGQAKKKIRLLTGHDRAAILSPSMVGAWRATVVKLTIAADRKFFKKALEL